MKITLDQIRTWKVFEWAIYPECSERIDYYFDIYKKYDTLNFLAVIDSRGTK